MGNKHPRKSSLGQILKESQVEEVTPQPQIETPDQKTENILWLDPNVDNEENKCYQELINEMNKFNLFLFKETNDIISKLETIAFEKTYILLSGSLSEEFFKEFEKIINEIKICPIIIIFTSKNKFNLIKKNILGLEKFELFNIDLVFDNFGKIDDILSSESKYKPNPIPLVNFENYENCFTFDYVNELRDLIFPLTFTEFIEAPNKNEILEFNKFLLDKYNDSIKIEEGQEYLSDGIKNLNELIEQLLIDVKIPIPILVKYWIRAYTAQSPFYREINYILIKKLNNEFDIYIRALYHGLRTKSIKSLIDKTLYRGAKIKIKEINYIEESLKKKKEDLPGCICYNKSFFSTSLDKNTATYFMGFGALKPDEKRVLFVIKKEDNLDLKNATNIDVQNYSFLKEKEILFLPFSCFEVKNIENCNLQDKTEYCEINLTYIGKYKNKINNEEKIPENKMVKDALSLNFCDKNEMNKESNKTKFDFNVEKYIPPNLKKSYIIALYDITDDDINKKVQILNFDEQLNKNKIQEICDIYLNGEKITFTFEYTFNKPGKYTFTFEFKELLINANKLFCGCSSLINLNFNLFKSNYITDMTDMFNGCSKLSELDLSAFKTKEVLTMKRAFKGCCSLKSLDLSTFETHNVKDMSEMFSECSSLTLLNFSNFKTEKVKTMHRMFYKCSSLYYINLSNFQSNSVVDISEMFADCSSLNSLDLSLFEINDKINTDKMFLNCLFFKSLKDEYISGLTNENIENSIIKICNKFFETESKTLSRQIQNYTKDEKYKNMEILNQTLEEFTNEIKHINILILGENTSASEIKKSSTLSSEKIFDLESEKSAVKLKPKFLKLNLLYEENYDCYEAGYLRFYEGEKINNNKNCIEKTLEKINDLGKKGNDFIIHIIWFCVSGAKINNNEDEILTKLMNKYQNKIQFFILHLNTGDNSLDNFNEFKDDCNKKYHNKKYELFQISSTNIYESEQLDEIINKININFNNILMQNIKENLNIIEKIKAKIEAKEVEKNLNDIPTSMSKYFENLLGKRDDIKHYIFKHFITLLNYYKDSIDIDFLTYFIENFKKEKLKLKVTKAKSKNLEIENLDNEFNKELKNKSSQIAQDFYQNKFKEELFKFFIDFFKKEAEKIIIHTIKDLKIDDLKPFIEKNINFNN